MKKNSLLKLLVLTLAVAMLLSMFVACDNTEDPTETPTDAPTEAPTQAPTEAPTQAPTEEATQAPTESETAAPTESETAAPTESETAAPTESETAAPTESETVAPTESETVAPTESETVAPTESETAAPTESETVAPTESETVAPTESETVTETETEYAPAVENEIKDDYTYLISVTQENADKILYLTGEMSGYYFATTEDYNAALVVRAAATEGGFYLFYYNGNDKVYINIVSETKTQDDGSEKTFNNVVYSAEAVSVWTYDATLGTPVTKVGDKTFFLGTYGDFTTISATDAEKYPDNFKATLRVPEPGMCKHPYAMSEEGHWKIACARCEKAAGSVKDHYYIEHTVSGDVIVDACTVCGYVVPMPDSVQLWLKDTMIVGAKTPNFQFTISAGEDEDGTKYNRFGGSEKSANHAAQSIWVGKTWGGERINAGNAKYLAIKMRGTGDLAANTFRFNLGASGNTEALGGIGIRFDLSKMITEGEWTWVVIDLEKALVREDGTDVWVANEEGNYMIDHMYFHTEPHAVDCYYDFATMAFVSDWSGVEWIMDGATEYEYVTAGGLNTVTESSSVTDYSGAFLNTDAVIKNYHLKNTVTEEGYLNWDPDDDVGQWILTRAAQPNYKVLSDDVKYFVVKVRKDSADAKIGKDSFNISLGTAGGGKDPEVAIAPYIDTEFKTFVIDLATVQAFLTPVPEGSTDFADYIGKTVLRQLQVTMYGTEAKFDVEFMAFVDDWSAIGTLAGTDKVYYTAEDASNATLEPVAVNAKDGSEWVAPATVLDVDYLVNHNPRVNWKFTVAQDGASAKFTGVDGNTGQFVMIQEGRDASFTADHNLQVESGRFAIIRVKSDVEGLPMRWDFGTSAAGGAKGGIYFKASTEYKTYVLDLAALNTGWVANEDGTYTVNVMNIYFGDGSGGSMWTAEANVWVDYCAFATTWAQVDELVADETVEYVNTYAGGWDKEATTVTQNTAEDPTATPTPTNVKVNAGSYGTLWQGTVTSEKADGVSFTRFTTTADDSTCQLIYKDPWRGGAATSTLSPIDAKTCGLFVMTFKTSEIAAPAAEDEAATTVTIRFSTDKTEFFYKADGTTINADKTVTVVFASATVAEWTTVVIDLKTVCADAWIAGEDGTYKVDDLTIQTFGAKKGEYLDIAYMGFVETWAGVDYVVDAENALEITAADGTSASVVIADKVAAEQTPTT